MDESNRIRNPAHAPASAAAPSQPNAFPRFVLEDGDSDEDGRSRQAARPPHQAVHRIGPTQATIQPATFINASQHTMGQVENFDDPLLHLTETSQQAQNPEDEEGNHEQAIPQQTAPSVPATSSAMALKAKEDEDESVEDARYLASRADISVYVFVNFVNEDRGSGVYNVSTRFYYQRLPATAQRSETHQQGTSESEALLASRRDEFIKSSVQRSIGDFIILYNRLKYHYEGIIIPPLPEFGVQARIKHGSSYDEFRRRSLERFIHRVQDHPQLNISMEFRSFLQISDPGHDMPEWYSFVHDEKFWKSLAMQSNGYLPGSSSDPSPDPSGPFLPPVRPTASSVDPGVGNPVNGPGLVPWAEFKLWQTARSINRGLETVLERQQGSSGLDVNYLAASISDPSSAAVSSAASAADERLRTLGRYLNDVSDQLFQSRENNSASMRHRLEHSRSIDRLSQSLEKLIATEGGNSKHVMRQVVECLSMEAERSINLSGDVYKGCTPSPTELRLEDLLSDFYVRSQGAKHVVARRMEEKEVYEHALEAYTRLRDQAESTNFSWSNRDLSTIGDEPARPPQSSSARTNPEMDKWMSTQQQLRLCTTRLGEARNHYEKISKVSNHELRRFRDDMEGGLKSVLKDVILENVLIHSYRLNAWTEVLEAWEQMEATDAAAAQPTV